MWSHRSPVSRSYRVSFAPNHPTCFRSTDHRLVRTAAARRVPTRRSWIRQRTDRTRRRRAALVRRQWALGSSSAAASVMSSPVHVPAQNGIADEAHYRHELMAATGPSKVSWCRDTCIRISPMGHPARSTRTTDRVSCRACGCRDAVRRRDSGRRLLGRAATVAQASTRLSRRGRCHHRSRRHRRDADVLRGRQARPTGSDDRFDTYTFDFDRPAALSTTSDSSPRSSIEPPARSWCWVEYAGGMINGDHGRDHAAVRPRPRVAERDRGSEGFGGRRP